MVWIVRSCAWAATKADKTKVAERRNFFTGTLRDKVETEKCITCNRRETIGSGHRASSENKTLPLMSTDDTDRKLQNRRDRVIADIARHRKTKSLPRRRGGAEKKPEIG